MKHGFVDDRPCNPTKGPNRVVFIMKDAQPQTTSMSSCRGWTAPHISARLVIIERPTARLQPQATAAEKLRAVAGSHGGQEQQVSDERHRLGEGRNTRRKRIMSPLRLCHCKTTSEVSMGFRQKSEWHHSHPQAEIQDHAL